MASIMTEVAEDYRALREGTGVGDLSSWTVLRLRGPDVRPFLQGLATQDLERETAGAHETLFLNEKGRPLSLAWVFFDTSLDAAWVLADEGARELLPSHFERFRVMEDVQWEGPEGMPRLLGIPGPACPGPPREQAVSAGGEAIPAAPLSFVLLPRTIEPPRTARPEALEAWRLWAGLPRTGIDFDTTRIATELSLSESISLSKGCFVGQEVVARTSHRGNVRRRRVGFRFRWPGEAIQGGTEIR